MKMESLSLDQTRRKGIPGIRYVFAAMGFLGFCVIYSLRVCINVAIVAMVNESAVYNESALSGECQFDEHHLPGDNITNFNQKDGEFAWSPNMQNLVLGSFYFGYCVTQIPGGRLSEMYSAKDVFGYGTFITAVLTLLTPLAAKYHVIMLVAIRILEGLAQGVTMPAMHSMLGKWLPESEKGFLSTFVYIGINVGTVVAMTLSGILCESGIFGGWPSVFYLFGFSGCVWFVLWLVLVTDSPIHHPWITLKEMKYITDNQTINHLQKLPSIPWLTLLKSVPFWALIITQFGQDWCFFTLITDLPTFMDTILHFNIKTNGLLSSMPYLFQTVVGCLVGCITDMCIRRKHCSKEFVRKFCNTVSCVGTAVGLVGVCLSGCNVDLTVAMFTTTVGIGGFCYCGYMLSHLDLSPEYAGTLMGIANTISNLTGFIAPAVVGALTNKYQTLHQWHIVFYITTGIVLFTCVIFLFFSTTRKQYWVQPTYRHSLLDQLEDDGRIQCYGTLEISTMLGDPYE